MSELYTPIAIFAGCLVIAVILFLKKNKKDDSRESELQNHLNEIQIEKSKIEASNTYNVENLQKRETELIKAREEKLKLNTDLAEMRKINENLVEKLETQKAELEVLQKKFTESFENLANRIFDEKSEKFSKQNKSNLDEILQPLRDKIMDFSKKVDDSNEKNRNSHASLIAQINSLKDLNKQISDDASNLTKALKGDVKIQGNWGEIILERILEESGLTRGIEYEIQAKGMGLKSEEGGATRPDVIIKLPENKHIIVDSKVSLLDYEKLIVEEDADQKLKHLKDMNNSVKKHIDGLHSKHYHELKGLNSPDFVFLFIPIEGVFTLLMQQDSKIYQYALNKQIVIISPSTLLATLRTVAFIWRQENQTKNAVEIARQSGNLYDGFVRFLEELEKVGTYIKRADTAHSEAIKKLHTGKGNLVSRVEKIKKLGAKASKKIPAEFETENILGE